ncbi:hypothetical protein BASA81_000660 [Batrachochytrium salamandrivorans]|nr:hypothetical protein BASA81_000660 [Batrachochytrium salamandrivorans]
MSRLVLAVAFLLTIHTGFITALQIKRLAGVADAFCHLQVDGQIYCAGRNAMGNLGLGSKTAVISSPTQMLGVTNALDVAMGESHTCIVDQGGQAKCVGDSQYYQLGDGTSMSNTVLVNVVGLETGVAQVFGGLKMSCALLTTGAARCWGSSLFGALGSGTVTDSRVPLQVVGFETGGALQLAIGEDHTCFLSTLGKVSCAGYMAYGQLGNGVSQFGGSTTPTSVIGLGLTSTFISVSCGNMHSCAVTTEGGVLCWGGTSYGQLGVGSVFGDKPIPQQVLGMTSGAASVWASGDNTFVIMEDGTAMGFGYNSYGELGVGNSSRIYSPVVFAYGVGNIKEVRGGEETTCILQLDDTVQCLGYNTNGQFGNGSVSARSYSLVTRLTVAQLPPTPPNTFPPTTLGPTQTPTTLAPTKVPTLAPTLMPTKTPTLAPTRSPTNAPTTLTPTLLPTPSPTRTPTQPTPQPTKRPTRQGDTSVDGGGAMATGSAIATLLLGMLLF